MTWWSPGAAVKFCGALSAAVGVASSSERGYSTKRLIAATENRVWWSLDAVIVAVRVSLSVWRTKVSLA